MNFLKKISSRRKKMTNDISQKTLRQEKAPPQITSATAPRSGNYRSIPELANISNFVAIAVVMLIGGVALLGRIAPANFSSSQWLGYNNTFDSQRFSPLKEITVTNVGDLKETCELALGDDGSFQSGPLVIGDTLYVTTAHTTVALGAADCAVRWRHAYTPEEDEVFPVNRGLAYLDGRLFRGTADGRLLAIDAKTGTELWRVRAGDPKQGEFFSAAPIAWNGMVFIGPAGSDWGIRGRMAAFDASTGEEVWRFDTVPMGDEPGAKTWKIPDTAKHGGGATWTSYTLDTSAAELFVPVANPAPDVAPDVRPGDNLYTNSVVVLDAKTGKLKWYYQLDPNDGFDWDLGAAPVLYTDRSGQQRVLLGSKDGYVYSIDRQTHKLVFKTPVTTIFNADKKPTREGIRACPGSLGGVEWNGPAYNPQTNTIYVGADDWCAIYRSGEPNYEPGKFYMGTDMIPPASEPKSGWVTALDSDNGKVTWRFHAAAPVVAGVTPTASGLVFAGDMNGDLMAFDARTGKVFLKTNLNGALAGGIITYGVEGHQYVAATVGNSSRLAGGWWGESGTPRMVIMTTGLEPGYQAKKLAVQQPEAASSGSDVEQGKRVFTQFCGACHGVTGEGGTGPRLTGISTRKTLDEVITFIKNPAQPMPTLFPSPLNEEDVKKVAAYVETLH
jgi:alcohol dehydrogenase (cytochrome c)